LSEFNEALTETISQMEIGRTDVVTRPGYRGPFMGPLYSHKAVEKFQRYQTMAHRESKQTLLWGKALETPTKGYFVTPGAHLLQEFDNNSAYQGNVLFCP